jgi:cell division initiation protein
MRYTPVELRHIQIGRTTFGGYGRRETDQLLEDIAESFEDVWRERGELTDKLDDLEKRFDELKKAETLFASTLVSAERAAVEAREAAKREAELIVAEAHQEARSVTRSALGERERLFAEVRRIETLLRAALGLVEESRSELPVETGGAPASDGPVVVPAPAPSPEHWPRREDTREFEALLPALPDQDAAPPLPALPPVTIAPDEDEDDAPQASRDFAWG